MAKLISDVTLKALISKIKQALLGKSDVGHIHETRDINNLEDRLQTKANVNHTHTTYATKDELSTSLNDKETKFKQAVTSSSGSSNANKYTKIATIDVSSSSYNACNGIFDVYSNESRGIYGQLAYYIRTGSTIDVCTIDLQWVSLNNINYQTCIKAIKTSDGIVDLYYKPKYSYETVIVSNVSCSQPDAITMYSNQGFVDTLEYTSSSYLNNVSSTLNNLTATIDELNYVDGVTSNIQTQLDSTIKLNSGTVSDANDYLVGGYTKTTNATLNVPFTPADSTNFNGNGWGFLFCLVENEDEGTGIQIFYPVDGDGKGKVYIRTVKWLNRESGTFIGEWGEFDPNHTHDEYILEPTTEGTNGQVLTTDGNGGRIWSTVSGGGGTGTVTSDVEALTNDEIDAIWESALVVEGESVTLTQDSSIDTIWNES